MAAFLEYAAGLFFRPHAALQALLADPRRVWFGFLGHVVLAAVYFAGISVGLALGSAPVPQFLVIRIPAERYYHWERFFVLPAGLAGTILASGTIRLAALLWNGQGRYEDLFALLGFGLIVVAVLMGLPDLVLGILAGRGIVVPPGWGFVGPHVWLGTLWYLVVVVLAVRAVEGLPWVQTIVLALLGFAANGVVQFILMR